jgi:hypothetical protein
MFPPVSKVALFRWRADESSFRQNDGREPTTVHTTCVKAHGIGPLLQATISIVPEVDSVWAVPQPGPWPIREEPARHRPVGKDRSLQQRKG